MPVVSRKYLGDMTMWVWKCSSCGRLNGVEDTGQMDEEKLSRVTACHYCGEMNEVDMMP